MREYFRKVGRKEIPVLHSTQIWDYLLCPKLMQLSQESEIEPSKSMLDGLIIERMVLGDKDNKLLELTKGKRENTMTEYARCAELIKPYFANGEPFKVIEHKTKEYILTGEIDYYTENTLYDLKITSSHRYWDEKHLNKDFLQAIYYNYIINQQQAQHDFIYIVFAKDVGFTKRYKLSKETIYTQYEWMKDIINSIVNEPFWTAYPAEDTCLKQQYGTCNYLTKCKDAQTYFNGQLIEVSLAD